MKYLKAAGLAIWLAGLLAACGGASSETIHQPDATPAEISEARLVAAFSYADWCGPCKKLEPKINEARAGGDLGAAFVTLDYTARDRTAFFAAADAAGIGEPVRAHYAEKVISGQLLLIDVDDGKIVQIITRHMSPGEISRAIKKAAAAA